MADLDVAVVLSGRDEGASAAVGTVAGSLDKIKTASEESGGALDRLWSGISAGIGIAAGMRIFETIGGWLSSAKDAAIGFNQTLDGARATMSKFFDSGESVNNSIANLNALAAKTPFAFEGLLTAQQRTIGAAQSAEQLKQNMDAIAVTAANTGRVSTANMDSISLALGQIQSKGHLAGGEMMQLTEAGVNMGQILAAHFHTTTGAITEMTEKGKISAQDVFAAMREYAADPKNREALDKLANTWEGAWSTIEDVSQTTIAGIFRPFFDLMTEGAIAIANFLQSENFQTWAAVLTSVFGAAADGIRAFLTLLEPIGAAIATAFDQITHGDFSAAFGTLTAGFSAAFGNIWTDIQAFVGQMFGAGENVVSEFAGGILQAAGDALQGAVNFVTDVISSFLIGNSPPPEGPLSAIDKGGQNLMETYGAGMKAGLGPSKAAVGELATSIRDIGGAIDDLTTQHNDLKNQIDDAKRSYEDQIRPLQQQLDIIKQKGDAAGKEAELQFKIQENNLKQLEFEAKGDPVRRAELQGQLATLQNKEKELGLADSIADVERQRQKISEDGQKAQLDDLQYQRQREELLKRIKDAEQKAHDAKTGKKEGTTGPDPSTLQAQLKELDMRHQIAEQTRKDAEADAQRKLASLDVKGQELGVQKEIADLTDKSKLGEIAKEKELLQSAKDQYQITKDQAEIEKAQQINILQQQIKDIKNDEGERVRQLQEQMALIDRQKQGLEDQRKSLTAQKGEMSQMLAQQKEAETAAAKAQKTQAQPGAPAGGLHVDMDAAQKEIETRVKQSAANIGRAMTDGFNAWVTAHFWEPIKALTAAGPEANGIGGLITSLINYLIAVAPRLATVLVSWEGVFLDWVRDTTNSVLSALSELILGVYTWIETNAGPLGDKFVEWELALYEWAGTGGIALLDKLAAIGADILSWVADEGLNLAGKLADWAVAYVKWVGPVIPQLLTALGGLIVKVVEWIGTNAGDLLDALGHWALAFVQWVGPKIGPLLIELGKLSIAVTGWILTVALPAIVSKLLEWGEAIIAWVGPRIAPLLLELGKLLVAVTVWLATEALPAIVTELGKWALAFIEWVVPMIAKLVVELAKIGVAVMTWIGEQVQPGNSNALPAKLGLWTAEFLGWCADVAGAMVAKLTPILTTIVTWLVTTAVPAIVAEVFKLGVAFGNAIYAGIDDFWQHTLFPWLQQLGGAMMATFGWVGSALNFAGTLAQIGVAVLTGVYEGLTDYWTTSLSPWLSALPDAIYTAFGWIGGALSFATTLGTIGRAILTELWNGLDAYWRDTMSVWWISFKDAVFGAFGWVGSALTWAGELQAAGRAILTGMWEGLDAYWRTSLSPWWTDFPNALGRALRVEQAGEWLKDTGKAILQGLQDGINGALEGFWNWLQANLIDKIPEAIRKLLHLDQDSGEMAMVGERMVEELKIGIRNAWPSLEELMKNLGGGLGGNELIRGIQALAEGMDGKEFGRAAAAIASAETGGGKNLSEIGGTGAKGPFQFDPGGELKNYAKYLHMSVQEAGDYATLNPLAAAQWALEGYLGDALRHGMSKGLSGVDLAVYGEKYGERPYEPDDDPDRPYRSVREWYGRLFGLEHGGIIRARPGGTMFIGGEGGADEAVTPLPSGWRGSFGGDMSDDTIEKLGAAIARNVPPTVVANGIGMNEAANEIARVQSKHARLRKGRSQ